MNIFSIIFIGGIWITGILLARINDSSIDLLQLIAMELTTIIVLIIIKE